MIYAESIKPRRLRELWGKIKPIKFMHPANIAKEVGTSEGVVTYILNNYNNWNIVKNRRSYSYKGISF